MVQAKVRQQYNQKAAVYDRRWSCYVASTLSFLKSWSAISPADVVLDVACGTGEFERLLLSHHPEQQMVGVDISENMLREARQKLPGAAPVSFRVASVTELPLSDRCFDVVVCASSFHYFEKPTIALAEIKRVLKPGGRAIVLDWCRDYFICQLCDFWLRLVDPAHRQCYTQAELHALLTAASFEICRHTRFRFGVVWGLMVAEGVVTSNQGSRN
ncbi:MAG: class I SAM-dependent methyltransferase [Cyanophyceae cyanobacterium]